MSFAAPKGVIEENDTVILYLHATNRHAIVVTREIKNKNGDSIEYVSAKFRKLHGVAVLQQWILKTFLLPYKRSDNFC